MPNYRRSYRTIMDDHFPEEISIRFGAQTLLYRKRTWKIEDESTGDLVEKGLRYGENPGQEAALYELINGNLVLGDCAFIEPGNGLVSAISEEDMLHFGKHPGKINLTDVDNALNILKYLMTRPAVAIMKHNNPCGVAQGDSISHAYGRANLADRVAAFGGCVAANRSIDKNTAEMIQGNYVEVVVAPDYEEGVLEILKQRRNLRVIRIQQIEQLADFRELRFVDFKSLIDGGLIVQQSPINAILTKDDFQPAIATYRRREYATERLPTDAEYEDLLFGWNVEQGITSNSVIYVKNGVTVGIGTGEQDRVGVAQIAIYKAYTKYADMLCFQEYGISYNELVLAIARGERTGEEKEMIDQRVQNDKGNLIGAAMISDAFFPARDGVDVAIQEGITAIAQPGGSIKDYEVIQACNEADPPVAMVFTGQRCFKH